MGPGFRFLWVPKPKSRDNGSRGLLGECYGAFKRQRETPTMESFKSDMNRRMDEQQQTMIQNESGDDVAA